MLREIEFNIILLTLTHAPIHMISQMSSLWCYFRRDDNKDETHFPSNSENHERGKYFCNVVSRGRSKSDARKTLSSNSNYFMVLWFARRSSVIGNNTINIPIDFRCSWFSNFDSESQSSVGDIIIIDVGVIKRLQKNH